MRGRLCGVAVMGMTLGLAVPPAHTRAQEPTPLPSAQFMDPVAGISVDEAVRMTLAREPSLVEARARIEAARGMRHQAGLRPNPGVMFERRDAPAGMDAQTMASVEWPLDLRRRPGRVGVADREVDLAEVSVTDRERLMAGDVRARYGAVLVQARLLDVLAEIADVTRRQRDLTAARVTIGAAPPVERDVLDVELGRLTADVHLQTGRAQASLAEFRRLLALPPDAPLRLRNSLEEARRLVPSAGSAPGSGAEARADQREAAARVAVAEARADKVRRDGGADLSVFGGYMRMDSGFPLFGTTAAGMLAPMAGVAHMATGGLRVTLPFNRNQGEQRAVQAERLAALAAVDSVTLTVEAERTASAAMLDAARQAVTALASTRDLARRVLSVVEQSHDLGRGTIFDVLVERRRVVDVERAYVEALGAEYDAAVMVNLATGGTR